MAWDIANIFDPIGLIAGGGLLGLEDTPASLTQLGQSSKLSTDQQKMLSTLLSYYQGYAGGVPLPDYTGERVAGLSDTEKSIQSLFGNYLSGANASVSDMLSKYVSGEKATPQYLEEYYKTNIEAPTIKNWRESIMPELSGAYAKRGLLYGSGVENARNASAGTLADSLTKGRADLYSQMEQISSDNQFKAASQSLQNILGLTSTGSTLGKTSRDVEQSKLDAQYQAWLRNQPGTRPYDSLLAGLLGIDTQYDQTNVATPADNSSSSMAGSAMGAAAAAAAAAA